MGHPSTSLGLSLSAALIYGWPLHLSSAHRIVSMPTTSVWVPGFPVAVSSKIVHAPMTDIHGSHVSMYRDPFLMGFPADHWRSQSPLDRAWRHPAFPPRSACLFSSSRWPPEVVDDHRCGNPVRSGASSESAAGRFSRTNLCHDSAKQPNDAAQQHGDEPPASQLQAGRLFDRHHTV